MKMRVPTLLVAALVATTLACSASNGAATATETSVGMDACAKECAEKKECTEAMKKECSEKKECTAEGAVKP